MVLTVDIILGILNTTIYTHITRIKIFSHLLNNNNKIKQNKKLSWFKGCHDI